MFGNEEVGHSVEGMASVVDLWEFVYQLEIGREFSKWASYFLHYLEGMRNP